MAVYLGLAFILLMGCQNANINISRAGDTIAWQKLGPGGGGSTFIPTFSDQSPDHFLVRCDMTGSYLTTNGGRSYQQINFANGANAFAYAPGDSNTIYIGSAALNRSVDGGKTWSQIYPKQNEIKATKYEGDHASYSIETIEGSLYESGAIDHIRVDPVSAQSIYFSTGNFFFYSADNGNTWKKENLQQPIDFIYTNAVHLKNEVYIFTEQSMYIFQKSTGQFNPKKLPASMSPAYSFTGGTLLQNGEMIFYALHNGADDNTEDEFGNTEVWTSDDKGETWKQLDHPLLSNKKDGIKPSYSMIKCAEFDAGQAYLVCNKYEEKKDAFTSIYWYGAIKTNDAGKEWNWVWKGGGGSGQYAVKDGIGVANLKDAWVEKAFGGEYIRLIDVGVYGPDGNVAVITDWYRTMKTIDGGKSWNEIYSVAQPDGTYTSNGMDVTTTYGVHFNPFDTNHIAISYTDIGYHHSFNNGRSWSRSVNGVPAEWANTCYWVQFDPEIKNKMWSAWSGMHDYPRGKMTRNPNWKARAKGGICVSVDGGLTWKPCINGMGFDSPATSIVLDSNSTPGKRTLYASVYNKGIFKSTDDGTTWELKNKGIESNTCAFELTLTSNGNLFVTVSPTPMHKKEQMGREYYSGAVYKSTDGAESWTKLNVVQEPFFPNGIDFDKQNPNRIYLACWASISLSDLIGGAVARSTGGNETINMPGGIFLSEDAGQNWAPIFDQQQYVYDVTTDPYHPGRVYCNTFNKAAYRSDDYGKSWKKIKGYGFHWGHRIVVDENQHDKIYITSFGSSVLHGYPETE